MTKQAIYDALTGFIAQNDGFRILTRENAEMKGAGLVPFDAPLIGACDAKDEWFDVFQREGVVGPHHKKPEDWLSDASHVISVFLPKSEAVRISNRVGGWPSDAWLYARYEGQMAINRMAAFLCAYLQGFGFAAVAPSISPGFTTGRFTSNWSERHVAYACNLGTFSLSKGLITEKGVAGRFFSVVTDAPVPADARQTREREEACSHCGICIERCPAGAISLEGGKDHEKCKVFLDVVLDKCSPRYGCGKCQTGTPCESGNPYRLEN